MIDPTQYTVKAQLTWTTQRVGDILPVEFYDLIEKNRAHIRKTFPITTATCIDVEATAGFLKLFVEREESKENFFLFMRDDATKKLIGFACVKNITPDLAKCELAYFADKDCEGRGIITKAVADLLVLCFGELKMNKVYICTPTTNIASQKVALKNGFTHEGILRDEFRNGDGEFEDVVYFALLNEDYNER